MNIDNKRTELYTKEDCDPMDGQNLEGKILVVNPNLLMAQSRKPQNQLWRADYGFGCNPNASGNVIVATCLNEGAEEASWDRGDFIGILKETV